MKKKHKLTRRQHETYRLIKARTEAGNVTTISQIVSNYKKDEPYPDGYIWRDKTSWNHDNCSNVWKDINAINRSLEIEKSILFDSKGNFWCARSLEEVQEYVDKRYKKRAMILLARASILLYKARQNAQGKLLSVRNEPIDKKSRARAFVESFVNSGDFSYEIEEALEEFLAS